MSIKEVLDDKAPPLQGCTGKKPLRLTIKCDRGTQRFYRFGAVCPDCGSEYHMESSVLGAEVTILCVCQREQVLDVKGGLYHDQY